MKRLFRTITGFTLLICQVMTVSAEPPVLNRADVEQVLAQEYAGQPLYWTPQRLPAMVPQSAVGAESQLLKQLAELGVIEREASMEMRSLGEGSSRIELNWIYRWPDPDQDGVYFGTRQLAAVRDIGPVVNQGDGWFANVKVAWYVLDMPLWTEHPEVKTIRLFRRSRESEHKPFEAGLALVHRQDGWQLWVP